MFHRVNMADVQWPHVLTRCVLLPQALDRDPRIWLGRARMLCCAYPDVDWYKVTDDTLRNLALASWTYRCLPPARADSHASPIT